MNDFTQHTNCTNVGTVFVVHLIWRGKKLLVWLINELQEPEAYLE